jgi:hypothetical protein
MTRTTVMEYMNCLLRTDDPQHDTKRLKYECTKNRGWYNELAIAGELQQTNTENVKVRLNNNREEPGA